MIRRIAMSQPAQRLIRKTNNPKFYQSLNNNLPMLETVVATTFYSVAIDNSKRIEKRRKGPMHIQNVICGTSGIILSSGLNRIINKHKNGICLELSKRNIPNVNNIVKGVQVALPLLIFSAFLRFLIPILSTPVSTYMQKHRHKNHIIKK